MNNQLIKRLFSIAALVFLFFTSTDAWASMSKRKIQANLENKYDAKVLKMFIGKDMGRSVYFARIMFNGGNYNTAFQVNTLVIDSNTGKLLRQFRHGPSGRELSGNFDSSPNKQSPGALRGHIWR